MYAAPSTARKNALAVQPYYYHSSVFVDHTREDILGLLATFEESCAPETIPRSFALFAAVWKQCGWDAIHLKVLDPRGREAFLDVTARLFLEVALSDEIPLVCLGAVYGLFTFLKTQPSPSVPVFRNARVSICSDDYDRLLKLPQLLEPPLQQHGSAVLLELITMHAFLRLPRSEYAPMNPRTLPTYTLAIQAPPTGPGRKKKKGRPGIRDKVAGADATLSELENVVNRLDGTDLVAPLHTLRPYLDSKARLLQDVDEDAVSQASGKAVGRLQRIAQMYPTGRETERPSHVMLIKAESNQSGGLLKLVREQRANDPMDVDQPE
ncbi:hypothetical protein BKA62DRAFT_765362 [Auriculariales sp. MPI-PUGE-AT-0066]|nr:hypothetical protein BKA62DRAFT_765362 [Auriculariales sp. MPI-PUGE-AT-0066]